MHLDHVGVSAANLEHMTEWYCRALGRRESTPFDRASIGLRGPIVIGDDGFALELLQKDGSQPGLPAPNPTTALLTRGYGHIALRVADVEMTHPEGNLIELLDRAGPVGS